MRGGLYMHRKPKRPCMTILITAKYFPEKDEFHLEVN